MTETTRGKAPVDSLCTEKVGVAHVYYEDDIIYDAMLNQTNVQHNNNKYYVIQLLEDDNAPNYSVWFRWGRVGKNGQNKLEKFGGNLQDAMDCFKQKFYDKTLNDWDCVDQFVKVNGKYDIVKLDYGTASQEQNIAPLNAEEKSQLVVVESLLPKSVQLLIQLICDLKSMEDTMVELKYDARRAPLGKLTKDQVKGGYTALKKIADCIASLNTPESSTANDTGAKKFKRSKTNTSERKNLEHSLLTACNEFYTRIPHDFGLVLPSVLKINTNVIINANDFAFAVIDKANHIFDLEPTGLYLSFKKLLTSVDNCGITPYFLFNCGNEKRLNRITEQNPTSSHKTVLDPVKPCGYHLPMKSFSKRLSFILVPLNSDHAILRARLSLRFSSTSRVPVERNSVQLRLVENDRARKLLETHSRTDDEYCPEVEWRRVKKAILSAFRTLCTSHLIQLNEQWISLRSTDLSADRKALPATVMAHANPSNTGSFENDNAGGFPKTRRWRRPSLQTTAAPYLNRFTEPTKRNQLSVKYYAKKTEWHLTTSFIALSCGRSTSNNSSVGLLQHSRWKNPACLNRTLEPSLHRQPESNQSLLKHDNAPDPDGLHPALYKEDVRKMSVFDRGCLRSIGQAWWENRISNASVHQMSLGRRNSPMIDKLLTLHRFRWLRHVLRMPEYRLPHGALFAQPFTERQRPGGRQCMTRQLSMKHWPVNLVGPTTVVTLGWNSETQLTGG
ncbi:LOW QUALITY PROTEIN: hypothetical protein T265_14048 [Opisthorchis viverrini]|uniref:NAD(+) ADP-ribosyltransferase n=1 Tax=Opisthorchis viverrini TaxID=6198 RepID=A0A074ZG97_OPIVI|nr:LOW QUALITY PROTEIN: hypothetical protein T265_14048 [Opisthorchis viverrini]KER26223.1 LOW QUALITY PROTEIN: hypothetical protein T265_14048 [Opisthorchis viverrini]